MILLHSETDRYGIYCIEKKKQFEWIPNDLKDFILIRAGRLCTTRDPSAEGTGRKGTSYLDEILYPN